MIFSLFACECIAFALHFPPAIIRIKVQPEYDFYRHYAGIHMKISQTLLMAGAVLALSGTANAGLVEEVRIGVLQHNICVLDCDNADKEDGPDISAEVVFASPDFLSWAFSPRPYLGTTYNTAGDTSFYGGGLQWSFNLTDTVSFQPGLGYFMHDGYNENPFVQGSPESTAFGMDHVFMGSDDLFRTSLGLNWQFSEDWGAELIYEHFSHGQILGDGRNQGMDNLGVRLSYTFK